MSADLGFAVATLPRLAADVASASRGLPQQALLPRLAAAGSDEGSSLLSSFSFFAAALGAGALGLSARRRLARRTPTARAVRRHTQQVVAQKSEPVVLTQEEELRLSQGQAVQRQQVHGRKGTGTVVIDVDAPWFVALDRLRSFQEYPQMIPVIRHADVRSKSYNRGHYHVEADYKVSRFWLNISVVHQVDVAAKTVAFNLHPSSGKLALKEAVGLWTVTQAADDPNRCRVSLQVTLRASSLLPAWLVDYASQRALGRATSWLKPHVESVWKEQLKRGLTQEVGDELLDRQWQYSLA